MILEMIHYCYLFTSTPTEIKQEVYSQFLNIIQLEDNQVYAAYGFEKLFT